MRTICSFGSDSSCAYFSFSFIFKFMFMFATVFFMLFDEAFYCDVELNDPVWANCFIYDCSVFGFDVGIFYGNSALVNKYS